MPAAISDVEKMRQVFQNPELSDFKSENIKVLPNCNAQNLRIEVENFFSHCAKDDLLLFYFSGHGIRDERGDLYLATCDTQIGEGRLLKATAVRTDRIHEYMQESKSNHQVIILDCCFSGAFVRGLTIKGTPETIELPEIKQDIRRKLDKIQVEGRAILTSSTATQYSHVESDTESIYTRYLVEGITTGHADLDKDGWITAEELHDYVKQKVETSHKEMKPEFYPVRKGGGIRLTQVPAFDPKDKYSKIFEQLLQQSGNISDVDRRYLIQLQINLELPEYEAKAIEARVQSQLYQPSMEHQNALAKYRDAVEVALQNSNPINQRNRQSLDRLKHALKLKEEEIRAIESEVEFQRTPLQSLIRLIKNKKIVFGAISLLGVVSLIAVTNGFLAKNDSIERVDQNSDIFSSNSTGSIQDFIQENQFISIGEDILLLSPTNSKLDGIKAFKEKDWSAAIRNFSESLDTQPNDPETQIYLNNAKAQKSKNYISIVVSVPISRNSDVAEEILRGVAQAQTELNQGDGIWEKDYLLQVAVADDSNDTARVRELAQDFNEKTDFVAVIGHNSSSASKAAAPIYEDNLVMITPTSLASGINREGEYIFRTNPGVDKLAEALHEYIQRSSDLETLGICFDSEDLASRSSRDVFVEKIGSGSFIEIPCDFGFTAFSAEKALSEVDSRNVNAILLLPSVNNISSALDFASEARQIEDLRLFSSATMYTGLVLKQGQDVNGMILTVPWHRDVNQEFVNRANMIWGTGRVNWRTAASYDATLVIAEALEQIDIQQDITKVRLEIQQIISRRDFRVSGTSTVTGEVQFLSGNADIPAYLVKVQRTSIGNYDFCLLKNDDPNNSISCE